MGPFACLPPACFVPTHVGCLKSGFRLVFYLPHHPIHKLEARTSKDDLFDLILLIYFIFYHFPREFLAPSPGKTSLGPHSTALCLSDCEDAEAGGLFPSSNLRAKGNSKTGQRGKVCWRRLKLSTREESPELGGGGWGRARKRKKGRVKG